MPISLAYGVLIRGYALAMQGQRAEGNSQLQERLRIFRALKLTYSLPFFLSLVAEVCVLDGRTSEGLVAIEEASALARRGQRWHEPELHRLKGELTLQKSTVEEEAEPHFLKALEVARHQEAKSLELRAATSLARLWQQQGKTAEARDLLAPVYDWFTEGFDTADLKDAKTLLEELK